MTEEHKSYLIRYKATTGRIRAIRIEASGVREALRVVRASPGVLSAGRHLNVNPDPQPIGPRKPRGILAGPLAHWQMNRGRAYYEREYRALTSYIKEHTA